MIYGAAFELKSALSYDFEQERSFIYENISQDEFIKHLNSKEEYRYYLK